MNGERHLSEIMIPPTHKLESIEERTEYAKGLINVMENVKDRGILTNRNELEIKGRIINVMLRGYDIPLQGSTMDTIELKRVPPQPHFFKRKEPFGLI